MIEPLQYTFIFYFLVLPMAVGIGIDSKVKNKYPYGAACGFIFYFICALWVHFGISPHHGVVEPIIVMIAVGLSLFLVGTSFEYKRPHSGFRRHAIVFCAVSVSGLPLYAIRTIIIGDLGFAYPESTLPLFQFTLAVIGLVVLANVLSARLYLKNELSVVKKEHKDEDLISMRFEDMDEVAIDREFTLPKDMGIPGPMPNVEVMDMDLPSEEFHKK
jgi:hypothetical protein